MPHFSKKKLLLLGFVFVMLLVIPLTVYLAQQQQQTQSHANPNTRLTFVPANVPSSIGGTATFTVNVSPGSNVVGNIKLVIDYDSTKLEATTSSFVIDSHLAGWTVLQGPDIGNNKISLLLSSQSDPTKAIQTQTTIGTITFNVIGGDSATPITVSFDSAETQITSQNSINNGPDAFGENIFLSGDPATVTIQGDVSPTPTETIAPSESPAPTTSETPTDTPSPSVSAGNNQNPVCESLTPDVSTTGTAPYAINFTAAGSDSDGTISKVSFNFGEGDVQDVTSGGGIGTESINANLSHTYNNSGNFTASAVLTDDNGGVSDSSSCTVSVSISGGDQIATTATPTPLPDTGPSVTVFSAGAIGGLLFIIGALLFLAL